MTDPSCLKCTHREGLHELGICFQPVLRSPGDRIAKFCGCVTVPLTGLKPATTTTKES